ncbi:MAG: hypothetical protein ACREQM_17920, partial [Candidatus Dormibacteraceae bacterium]
FGARRARPHWGRVRPATSGSLVPRSRGSAPSASTPGAPGVGHVVAAAGAPIDTGLTSIALVARVRNDGRREKLQRTGHDRDRLRRLGWTDDVRGLSAASDVVIIDARGVTAMDALTSGRAVLVHRAITGHGRAKAELMVVAGLGEICEEEPELAAAMRRLGEDPGRLPRRGRAAPAEARGHQLARSLRTLVEQPRRDG